MKSLLLVAHGSRRDASNDEVRRLTEVLASKAGAGFGEVSCAFLELVEPSIPEAIRSAIDQGADEIVVMPYFLSAGRHVVKDIPEQVMIGRGDHREVDIRITPHLGASEKVADLLLALAAEARYRGS